MLSPFGLLLILVSFGILFASTSPKSLFLNFFKLELLFSFFKFNYGFFIKTPTLELQNGDIAIAFIAILSAIFLIQVKVHFRLFLATVFLFLTVCASIIFLLIFPSDASVIGFNVPAWDSFLRGYQGSYKPPEFTLQSILFLIRVCAFLTVLILAWSIFSRYDWISIFQFLIFASKVFLIIGFCEFIIKFGFGINVTDSFDVLLGRGVSTGTSSARLQGLSREPSYYALAIYNVTLLLLVSRRISFMGPVSNVWPALAIIIGAGSASFSFLWVGCSLALVLLVIEIKSEEFVSSTQIRYGNRSHWRLLSISLIAVIGAVAGSIFYLDRLAEVFYQINNALNSSYVIGVDFSSEASRLIGMFESLSAFFSRPIFGLGLGTVYCVSGLVSILSNVGIAGFLCWFILLSRTVYKLPVFVTACLLLPILFTNDLSSFYDFAYISVIPLLYFGVTCSKVQGNFKGSHDKGSKGGGNTGYSSAFSAL